MSIANKKLGSILGGEEEVFDSALLQDDQDLTALIESMQNETSGTKESMDEGNISLDYRSDDEDMDRLLVEMISHEDMINVAGQLAERSSAQISEDVEMS